LSTEVEQKEKDRIDWRRSKVQELSSQGHSQREIAQMLQVSNGTVNLAEQLQWRRSKVVEMRAKGMSQIEIAQELQVSDSSISSDMQYLCEQAKESIKEYVTEYLPEQYQVCLTALDEIIKRAFDILENSHDKRDVAGNGTIQRYSSSEAGIIVKRYDHRWRLELYQK
jgi:transcriptional regulator